MTLSSIKSGSRTILVTGCSSGIGLHCAQALQARGWRVFATARQLDDMVRAGRLADVARASAKDTAKRLKLGKQGARFVDLYAAQVQADPAALAALARAHD